MKAEDVEPGMIISFRISDVPGGKVRAIQNHLPGVKSECVGFWFDRVGITQSLVWVKKDEDVVVHD